VPSLVLMGGASVVATPGGTATIGCEQLEPTWRGARATDVTDPWEALRTSSGIPGLELPAGVELSASGGLAVAGLDWLGARVYDPSTRGFLSTDPLAPVLGAGWAGNPYSYAGNDPLHALDPLGLRPTTDADLDAYAKANQGALADAGDWWGENWEYVAAGAAIVSGVALMATGVGGPVGMVIIGAASGALVSGGVSVIQQKASTGDVVWGEVGVDAAIGGVMGGAAAGAGVFATSAMGARAVSAAANGASRAATAVGNVGGRVGTAVSNAGQQAITTAGRAASSQLGMNVIANSTVGGLGNVGSYMVTTPQEQWSLLAFTGAASGGAVSGSLGAVGGHFTQGFRGTTAALTTTSVGSISGIAGGSTNRLINGEDTTAFDLVFDAGSGGAVAHMPGAARISGSDTPGLAAHVGSAYASQHGSWIANTGKFVGKQPGVFPSGQ
jgi:RHS repeat-associated protein